MINQRFIYNVLLTRRYLLKSNFSYCARNLYDTYAIINILKCYKNKRTLYYSGTFFSDFM